MSLRILARAGCSDPIQGGGVVEIADDGFASAISRSSGAGRLLGMRQQPFDAIVTRYGPTVLRVCRAVLGPSVADDAWSETFLSAMKAYPDLPADANVEAWLVTIAHRKAIDVTRATRRRAIPTGDLPETVAAPVEGPDPELAGALAQLPPKQRQAVVYHYLAGLPYTDVAAILGGSTDASRRAAADGIAALRRSYPGVTANASRKRAPR